MNIERVAESLMAEMKGKMLELEGLIEQVKESKCYCQDCQHFEKHKETIAHCGEWRCDDWVGKERKVV